MKSENSNTTRHVTLRLPRNLRAVWAYPNLLHFEKYTDLLLLSASNERVAYNKTYIQVPYGCVLLKYAFFASRWHMAYNTARSIFNVLAVSGWLQIRHFECRTISNRIIKAPFLTFPKIGYDNNMISINIGSKATDKQQVLMSVSPSEPNSYGNSSQRLGYSAEYSGDGGDDVSGDDGANAGIDAGTDNGADVSADNGSDNGSASPTATPSIAYEDEQQLTGHQSEHSIDSSDDSSGVGLINNNVVVVVEENIKKKNKKEKKLPPPTYEEFQHFIVANQLTAVDVEYNFKFYSAAGWHDSNGEPISNWKQFFLKINQKLTARKVNQNSKPSTGTTPTTADKLARQNANLARNLAANVAGSK